VNLPAGTPSPDLDAEAENATADISTSIDEPSLNEVITAICKLKNGRAAGPEILLNYSNSQSCQSPKHSIPYSYLSGEQAAYHVTGRMVLYKGKGHKTDCSNYRPITLPGKVFAHVLLARIQPLLDKHVGHISQA